MALYRSQMAAYAREQYARGAGLRAAHHPDASGCCAACGRPAPCSEQDEGERLCRQYEPWVETADQAGPAPVADPSLVRPYVLPRDAQPS